MYDLTHFTLSDMTACGAALRRLGADARSMEEGAGRIVRYLYDNFRDQPGSGRACALVRFFVTYPFTLLTADLQAFALRQLGGQPATPGMKCLTLLATAGDRPAWNYRQQSRGHQAIPLPSAELVVHMPMIAQLVQQFGLEIRTLLQPDASLLMDLEQRSYNVFHVPEAAGSPYVPAQADFVAPAGVRSVLGFGGMLPAGNLFAVILFTRAAVPRATADLFKPLALSAKLAVLPFAGGPLWAGPADAAGETAS